MDEAYDLGDLSLEDIGKSIDHVSELDSLIVIDEEPKS